MRIRYAWVLLGVTLVSCGPEVSESADLEPQLLRPSFQSMATGEERQFLLYLPPAYEESEALWPVIFFLHGGGERGDGGDDLDFVMGHGPIRQAWIDKRDLPFIIVAPQLPLFGRDGPDFERPVRVAGDPLPRAPHFRAQDAERRAESPIVREASEDFPGDFEEYPDDDWPPEGWMHIEADLVSILDHVLAGYRADTDRVYLTGLSYGGFGTWDMAATYPDRWAAIAPIVGTGNLDDVERLAADGIPTWLIGSGTDPVVKPHWLYTMAGALERAGHPSLRFTVHEDMSHDAWRRAYEGEDLYSWFLQHRRSDR